MWFPKERLLKSSMMSNWHILAQKLLIAQTETALSCTDKLLGKHKSSPLPTTISLDCLPGQFSSYSHDKVAIIRNQLDCGTSQAHALL